MHNSKYHGPILSATVAVYASTLEFQTNHIHDLILHCPLQRLQCTFRVYIALSLAHSRATFVLLQAILLNSTVLFLIWCLLFLLFLLRYHRLFAVTNCTSHNAQDETTTTAGPSATHDRGLSQPPVLQSRPCVYQFGQASLSKARLCCLYANPP